MASSSESSSYGFAANLRRIATIYAVYCLKCKKQIDHQAETLSFIPDPNAKQNVTKGQRGEWRVAALYNEIYRLLLLEQKGSPLTPDEELPDPCNIDDSKLKQPAVRRIKDMLSIVAQAAVYVFRCKDIPLDKPTARLACITDPKFPTKFKKSLAQDSDKLWEDVRFLVLEHAVESTVLFDVDFGLTGSDQAFRTVRTKHATCGSCQSLLSCGACRCCRSSRE
eukprot:m.77019 g.77019  ORF g.77019 m.77019 type:complete len:223 (-) comp14448_c0_seq2:829-1497(-)